MVPPMLRLTQFGGWVRIINFNLQKTELKLGLIFGTCSGRGTDFQLLFKEKPNPELDYLQN
jgi:hypothetical protein